MKKEEVSRTENIRYKRIVTAIFILILVPLGILVKEYHGPARHFLSDKLAGSLYIMFWSLVFYFFFYRMNVKYSVAIVFAVTCLLEFLQRVTTPFLENIRSSYPGRALIGSSFSWSDFIFYGLGSILAYLIIDAINRSSGKLIKKKKP